MRKKGESDLYIATILGEPASKANSRQIVVIKGKVRVIKSKKARNYLKNFHLQCRTRQPLFEEDVAVGMKIYYKTRRPDLDESLILDALEGYAYSNDRQVKAKYIIHALDKRNPRSEIYIAPIDQVDKVVLAVDSSSPPTP